MKSIFLFLFLIPSSYCIKMTPVSRNSKTSLPTTTSENKYFYLTNSNYGSYSYIYICLEDNNLGLSYDSIKYFGTNTYPTSYTDSSINSISFSSISYYKRIYSSSTYKYYYEIPTTYYSYTIVYYQGSSSSGNLFVTADNNNLASVKMTQVYRNYNISLPTTTSQDKYFYLTNSEYNSYSSYVYICLEDKSFSLSYNSIKYCRTDTYPYNNPDNVVSTCSFITQSYDSYKISSGGTKYYYKFYISSYYYTIVYYEGSYSSGSLYVKSDYKDLSQTIKMTQAYRRSKISLPITSSIDKYFYVTNSDYYPYSNYLYIYLEDNSFGLSYNNIKYCRTNTNPYNYPDEAVKGCSFNSISYYDPVYLSSSKIYHYKIPTTSSYAYSIVYYDGDGSYSYGNLYVFCDYESTTSEDNLALSAGAIVGIAIGSISFLVICIIIMICCCPCCRRNKNNFIPVTQPNYFAPIYSAYPSNQYNAVLPVNNPNIPLQTVPMNNEAN